MPTGYTPIYRIMKGGIDITDHFNDRTTQIKVELVAGGGEGDRCVIMIDDRDWAVAAVEPGEAIQVYLGYQEIGLAYMGYFNISDVSYLGKPRSIQLTGTSTPFQDLQKSPNIKEFVGKSVGEILSDIAGETGIPLSIAGGLSGEQLQVKNQITSNLHLIHELERQYGAVAKVVDNKLMFVPRDTTSSATGASLPTLVLLPEHFGDWNVRYSGRSDYSGVKTAWYDEADKVRKWVESSAKGVGEGAAGAFTIGKIFKSEAEAKAAGNAKQEAFNRASVFAVFDLAKGDPWIRDTQTLLVDGMRDKINGSYVVDKATHTYIKSTGIRTNLECRAPGNGADFSDRADEDFLKPLPGEPMGAVIPDGTFNGPF